MNTVIGYGIGIDLILAGIVFNMNDSRARYRRSIRFYAEQLRTMKAEQYELRTQKHDLLSHVNTIHALACMQEYDELRSYTEQWARDVTKAFCNNDSNNPVLSALLQIKQDEAEKRNVQLSYRIEHNTSTELNLSHVDLVRMIGNSVYNAIECSAEGEPIERWVQIHIDINDKRIRIIVMNPSKISRRHASRMRNTQFTTKQNHSGYGLSIVRQLTAKLGGSLRFTVKGGQVIFKLEVPNTMPENQAYMV